MRRLYFLLFFITSIALARADDAAWMQVGDAGNFTKSKQIRMVEEEVNISLSNKSMRVHATFKFRNEGLATKVTMAFPDGIHDYKARKKDAPRAIRWLKSKVDGRPVKVTRQPYRSEKDNDFEDYTHVWTKTVPFKANQTRVVTVDYEANHGDIGDYIDDVYTLRTGATWKGPIGKAVLNIDWSRLRGHTDPSIRKAEKPLYSGEEAKLMMTTPRSARLEYRNFEPNFDISMAWCPVFGNFFVNGKRALDPPMDENRRTYISGNGSDPKIDLSHIGNLLTPKSPMSEYDREPKVVDFKLKGKRIQVENDVLLVNGKTTKLRRGRQKSDVETWIYIRDLIAALGGSYRFDSKWDRAYIKF